MIDLYKRIGTIAACALLGLCLYFALGEYRDLAYKVDTQATVIKSLQSNQAATAKAQVVREQSRAATAVYKENTDVQATKALEANPDWSKLRVPDDVIDAIGL